MPAGDMALTENKCKDCKMQFSTKKRLEIHRKIAHPKKPRTSKGGYWSDPGADAAGGM